MSARARAEALRARARDLRVPSLLLGALVALTTWGITFNGPGGGLDSSWGAGLFMAIEQGLDFGDEVVWTYGPLGFLGRPDVPIWFSDLAVLTFLYTGLLYVAVCTSVVWALRRVTGALIATLLAFGLLGVMQGIEQPLVIAVAISLALLVPDRSRRAVVAVIVGGSFLAALECMVKLSIGPIVFAAILIALIGARASRRELALFAGLFAVWVAALWLISGQSLADLDDYVLNSREVISGYSEAMGTELLSAWGRVAAIALLIVFVVGSYFGNYRDSRARWCAVALCALAGFAVFKEGVVRYDIGHITIFITTIPILWLLIPWARPRLPFAAIGAVALVAMVLVFRPGSYPYRLDPIDNVQIAEAQAEILLDGSRREALSEFSRALMIAVYDLDEQTLAELEGRSVAIEPWEIAVAWAYDLEWSPLPVMQGYQAYTESLDELNADALGSPEGPERILRQAQVPLDGGRGKIPAIDARYTSWDPPQQALAILCNYETLHQTEVWQVLGRTANRCDEPESIGTVEAEFEEEVAVPDAARGEVVFVRIEGAGVAGLEKIRSLLFRAEFRNVRTDGGDYRLVPGIAEGGLLLRGDPRIAGTGNFSTVPQTETIALSGVEGDLTFEFFRMRVGDEPAAVEGDGPS